MGSLIGGVIGGIGSLIGGSSSSDASKQAQGLDLTGYNYLTGANGTSGTVNNGTAANTASANLLGLNGTAGGDASSPAFNNYLNSTGYDFQMDQGQRAITGSAAAKGLLNSGATGKALTTFGQNLGATTFNNYLGQLNTQSAQGITAAGQIGQAGSSGGTAAGTAAVNGGNAMANGISTAANQVGGAVANNMPKINNFFGSL